MFDTQAIAEWEDRCVRECPERNPYYPVDARWYSKYHFPDLGKLMAEKLPGYPVTPCDESERKAVVDMLLARRARYEHEQRMRAATYHDIRLHPSKIYSRGRYAMDMDEDVAKWERDRIAWEAEKEAYWRAKAGAE